MDKGWIEMSNDPIAAGDERERIIVWHVYSGVMVTERRHAIENRFMTHWRTIDAGAWIESSERRPTREDADAYECVISRNKWGVVSMAGWHRFWNEDELTAWQHPPEPPDSHRELQI